MNNNALKGFETRRTIYALNNALPIEQEKVEAIIKSAVRQSPSPFNSQSSRVVIMFGDEHHKVWQFAEQALRQIVTAEEFAPTKQKLDAFSAGAGTILFFEDQTVIQDLQKKFAIYAEYFPVWSLESSGMAQFAVWTVLAEQGIGASLQHYNQLVEESIKKEWGLPESWTLCSQMPFGGIAAPAGNKDFIDDTTRFKTFS